MDDYLKLGNDTAVGGYLSAFRETSKRLSRNENTVLVRSVGGWGAGWVGCLHGICLLILCLLCVCVWGAAVIMILDESLR